MPRLATGIVAATLASTIGFWSPELLAQERVDWGRTPHASTLNMALTGTVVGVDLAMLIFLSTPPARWTSVNDFDRSVAASLRAESTAGRRLAARTSDVLVAGLLVYPWFDAVAVTGIMRDSPRTAEQMAFVDGQAFAITGLVKLTVEQLLPRHRPFVPRCRPKGDPRVPTAADPNTVGGDEASAEDYPHCHEDRERRSFFSGHSAFSFTSAGLTCAHHLSIEPYGDAGAVACASTLAIASTVALLRIVADEHHASDVLVGALIGFASGFGIPMIGYSQR